MPHDATPAHRRLARGEDPARTKPRRRAPPGAGRDHGIARDKNVDLALVCGDLFESSAPTPEAEKIVYQALHELVSLDIPVVVVAGNHDNPNRLEAIRPLVRGTRIHLATRPRLADDGGVLRLECAGERVAMALLPFLSQREIVKADALMRGGAAGHKRLYADRARSVIRTLVDALPDDAVRLFVGHLTVAGGTLGGGEREAHTVYDYEVPRRRVPQAIALRCPGTPPSCPADPGPDVDQLLRIPLQLDFGETSDVKSVQIVELGVRKPPRVDIVPLRAGNDCGPSKRAWNRSRH